MFCEKCGSVLETGALFCVGCGARINSAAAAPVRATAQPFPAYSPPEPQRQSYAHAQPTFANAAPPRAPAAQGAETMSVVEYLKILLLSSIPFVGIILLLVWAFGAETAPNKRNFSKAFLIMMAAVGVLAVIFTFFSALSIASLF